MEINKEIASLLYEFFSKDPYKVLVWLNTPNPNFGGVSPWFLMDQGRSHKVLNFIKNAKDENGWHLEKGGKGE